LCPCLSWQRIAAASPPRSSAPYGPASLYHARACSRNSAGCTCLLPPASSSLPSVRDYLSASYCGYRKYGKKAATPCSFAVVSGPYAVDSLQPMVLNVLSSGKQG